LRRGKSRTSQSWLKYEQLGRIWKHARAVA
jgi:hypothetical protein